jgi:hypothetical protein
MGGRTNLHDEGRSGRPSVMSDDLFQNADQKFVKDGASQFQSFRVNFHKCHALFSTRLSQLGYAITSFEQEGFRKLSRVSIKRREWLRFCFLRAVPQRWQ